MNYDFQEAWYWLSNHPIFLDYNRGGSRFQADLYMEISKVNPQTGEIEDEESLNTEVCIFLEHGPFNGYRCSYDRDLECQGSTYEEVIIALCEKVKNKYGNYSAADLVPASCF